jgi:hypothetical protein
MSKQNKRASWIKIGLTCLGLLILLKACGELLKIEDRLDRSEGNAAIQEIGEHVKIPTETIETADSAIYTKGAMPADLNMHFRFDIDRQVLDSFMNKHKLKAEATGGSCFPKSSYRRYVGDWWQPSEVQSKTCFTWNVENTDYYLAFKDLDNKTARVYIFLYNN